MINEDLNRFDEEEDSSLLPENESTLPLNGSTSLLPEDSISLPQDDAIFESAETGDRLEFGFSFAAQDGELGNQSEDHEDLPTELKKVGHQYNPNLSEQTGDRIGLERNELTDAMHIADKSDIGLSFNEKDSYTGEDLEDDD